MPVNLIYKEIPAVALRGLVIFPGMRLHFEVGRKKSIAAFRAAVAANQKIFLVTQRSISYEDPVPDELFSVGVLANIKQIVKSPDSKNIRVVVEGVCRASSVEYLSNNEYLLCNVRERRSFSVKPEDKDYADALMRKTKDIFEEYIDVTAKLAQDVAMEVYMTEDPSHLADFIAGNALTDFEHRQQLLEELHPLIRLEKLCSILSHEIEIFKIEEEIDKRVQEQMDKNQQEYYLREQLKAISTELGEGEDVLGETESYRKKIRALPLSAEVSEKLLRECDKLSKMQGSSPDANVIRSYLDACLALPWGVYTEDCFDLQKARKILDNEHYGMEKIKERFIEMLAVRALTDKARGQIICLVGPPGVGKTSIVRSIAGAMNRKYVRMSLGGVRDEAEIRGHRKTYIGAMSGRIVNALTQAKSFNPIILLDEIDKLSNDYKGDPSSALLEALDPEQNNSFRDHYIEFPVDLSRVIFITTANDSSTIPAPLLDRMEVIELSSYTSQEKLVIAKRHLVKKQREMHGLKGSDIRFTDSALSLLIDGYTREAGVRRLEQLIGSVCRKSAVMISDGEAKRVTVNNAMIEKMLGPVKFKPEALSKTDLVGVVNGLAWTAVGGELLQVEAVVMDGSGKLELTGNLGEVMKESAKAAHSYLRSVAKTYDIPDDLFKTKDIHIHVPQGAVPKDGPSAGVTIATALLSALTGRKVRQSVAMTGEISLTGRVMPIGGLREKTMAAYKNGIKKVIIPVDNESDLYEVEQVVKDNVEFVTAQRLEDVFEAALADEATKKLDLKHNASFKVEQKKSKGDNIAQ